MRPLLFISSGLISLTLLLSCSERVRSTKKAEPDYPSITDTVKMASVNTDAEFLKPTRLFIANNHLVMMHSGMDHMFNAYKLPLTGEAVQGVSNGRGPTELISPDPNSIIQEKDGFTIVDSDYRIKKITISDSDVSLSGGEEIFLSKGVIVQNGITKVGDSYLYPNTTDFSEENHSKQYIIVTKDGDQSFLSEYPQWGSSRGDNMPMMEMIHYATRRIGHPDGKKFAEFYGRYRVMRIIGIDGEILSETYVNYPTPWDNYSPGLVYIAFSGFPVTDGKLIAIRMENTNLSADTIPEKKDYCEVQIWDWKGNLKKRLILVPNMDFITLDFKSGIIYGAEMDNENTLFYADVSKQL
ncbi:MAG: hypothetical protein IKS22_01000 [Bacteroidales bacterium]|nr:hypothetical protein [Bacteroidales bacterium]